ncbi:OprD family porin [Pseudomonas nitroreducens]|uniref:OprD family porin n=1 Tax=Pseudomonas nitroreducens TaxID=46680 RepID=A0A5R9A431_PSENT|nr:OprD family porin [Pseudomonas nitroreducens]TLP72667.1 OprD family porin [Pseudomonas nitroreducens]
MFRNRTTGALLCSALMPLCAQADLIDDSRLDTTLRNFYMLRDYRQDNAPQSQAGSWSQAVLARFSSGFSEGTIGVGVDFTGFYALKLDGGAGTSNDSNLPYDRTTGEPVDDFSRGGATLKLRYSKTTLKVGLLEPRLPVIFQDDVRVLPQTFQGVMLESKESDRFKFTAAQLWNTSTRASSDRESFYLATRPASQDSNKLNLGGVDAQWTPGLSTSYYFAQLEDIYDQHYVGANFKQSVGENTALLGTLSYFHNEESGQALAGRIDNRAYGARLGVKHGGHMLSATYQRMLGEDMFPMLLGNTPQPYLVNWVTNGGFFWAQERSYQLRYDYDFASLGLPGLTLMTRYTKGTDISRPGQSDGHEYERDTDVGYTIQSGPLKTLSFLMRTSTVRSSYASDYDEVRFITSYPLAF